MKVCNLCEDISTELLEKIRDVVESLLEIRSQNVALQSVEAQPRVSRGAIVAEFKEKLSTFCVDKDIDARFLKLIDTEFWNLL